MEIIRCLLRARTDYITVRNVEWSLPSPDPGWTKCVDCRINKRAHGHCSVCNDTGYKRRRGEEDEWDTYLERAASSVSDATREIPNRPSEERDEDPVDRSIRQRESRNQGGSLDKLEQACTRLPMETRRFLGLVYDARLLSLRDPKVARREQAAVAQLSDLIPGRLEPPPWDRKHIRSLRVEKIRELGSASGIKVSEIAKAVGCSRRLVRIVLDEN